MKYKAYWVYEGKEILVFPRSKKTIFFHTVDLAARALERQGKRVRKDTRGIVRDIENNDVLTIAL